MSEIKELFSNRKTVISAVIVIILILGLAVGLYLIKNPQIFKSRATERKEVKQEEQKEKYVKGEVLVKFKASISKFKVKPGKEDKDLDREAVSISELDETTLPQQFQSLSQKYQIQKIEKVFKGVGTPQEEISKFKQKFSQELSQGKRRINEKELLKVDLSRTYKLSFNQDVPVESIIQELSQNPEIEYAEPNFIFTIQQTESTPSAFPKDPYFQDNYPDNVGHRDSAWNPNYDYQWNLKKIGMEQAWSIATGSAEVVVAVIDTGVDYTHPELGACTLEQVNNNQCAKIAPGYDFINNDNNPADDHGHGTHAAGIIAATTNNNIGIAGIANNAKIVPLKALNDLGLGATSQLASAIYEAITRGAKVINGSWGGFGKSHVLTEAITSVYANGMIFVAAAGNSNYDTNYFYPANIICNILDNPDTDCIITVASTDQNDQKSTFSNWGTNIDISAPGGDSNNNILSLKSGNISRLGSYTLGTNYLRLSGTSMAAPHVTALAALILGKNPDLTYDQVRNVLINGSDDLGDPSFDVYYGYGRINIWKTLFNFNTNPIPTAKLTSPNDEDIVKPNTNIQIKGIAFAQNFLNYKLEIYPEAQPTSVTLVSESTTQARNEALLGNWNLSNDDNTFIIKLTVFYQDGTATKSISDKIKIKTDHTLRNGWPVKINGSFNYPYELAKPIMTADLDLDNKKELLTVFRNSLYVFDDLGNLKWIKSTSDSDEFINSSFPSVGDIDPSYPGQEVVIYVQNATIASTLITGLMAWHADGTTVNGWPIFPVDPPSRYGTFYAPTIIKNQNIYRVVHNDNIRGRTLIYNGDGSLYRSISLSGRPSYPLLGRYNPFGSASAADLNGDGNDELIIHGSTEGWEEVVFALDLAGNNLWESPKFLYGVNSYGRYVVGDVNNDGKDEVVIVNQSSTSTIPIRIASVTLSIYQGNGEALPGWADRNITNQFMEYFGGVYNLDISLADLNKDNKPEIIIGIPGGYLGYHMVMDLQGNVLSGFPKNNQDSMLFFGYSTFFVGEIGSNTQSKGIIGSGEMTADGQTSHFLSVHQYLNDNLSPLEGYPKKICTSCIGSIYPFIASLDNNSQSVGISKYVGKQLTVYVFDLENSNSNNFLDWPQYRHDERHTGTYSLPSPTPTPFVCTACAADIVKSARNRVDAQDNALLSSCFGKSPSESLPGGKACTPADINKDGSINQTDVDCLRSVYFQACAATGSAAQR